MALEETSSVLIWDLNNYNSYVVPTASYDLTNFSFANNTMTDDDAWNILTMEENLDWILSCEPQALFPEQNPLSKCILPHQVQLSPAIQKSNRVLSQAPHLLPKPAET